MKGSDVIAAPVEVDPTWWTSGSFEGRSMRDILGERDMGAVLRFINRRGWSRSAIVAATGMTETAVRECWQGRRRIVSYDVLERIADGLLIPRGYMGLAYQGTDATGQATVGARRGMPADNASSQDYVGMVASLVIGAPQDVELPTASSLMSTRLPSVVTMREVEMLVEMTQFHRRYDAEFGGGSCRDPAAAYLAWAMGLLNTRLASEATRKALHAALSDLHQVVGWACHDLGEHAAARRLLVDALALAKRADDLPLIAGALYRLGRVSMHLKRAAEALKMWQLGQIAAQDSGCLISVAVLHANEAWAYAQLGDDLRVKDALARAEAERQRAKDRPTPGWARFFVTAADLTGMSGLVYSTLAGHGKHRGRYVGEALLRCESSLNARAPHEGRSRLLDMIGLAGAHVLDGDVDSALRLGYLAVDGAKMISSHRAVDRLRDVVDLSDALGLAPQLEGLSNRVEALAARG